MRRRLHLSLALVLLLYSPWDSSAQLAVFDGANLAQNSITSVQTFITAGQTILIELNQILELEAVSGLIAADGIAFDMAQLAAIIESAEGLSYDLASLQSQIASLFGLDTPPNTMELLAVRLQEIRVVRHQSYSYAMKVQTLLLTGLHTVEHVIGLLGAIGDYIGNKSANQRMTEAQHVMNKTLANQQAQTGTFQRAQAVDQMERIVTEAALIEINRYIWDLP